jgi:CRISPR-associated endonuclease/helicase Cas3
MTAPNRAWAKTDRGLKKNPPIKTVFSHGLETKTVAQILIPHLLPELTNTEKERVIWIASNHDIGKVTPPFQRKIQADYKKTDGELGHQILSSVILRTEANATVQEGKIVGAHHGVHQSLKAKEILSFPDTESLISDMGLETDLGGNGWNELRRKEAHTSATNALPKKGEFAAGRIAGFITLCDYVASSLKTRSPEWEEDLSEESCTEIIKNLLHELQLNAPLQFLPEVQDFTSLIGKTPRQFQNLIWQGPGIYLLEAPTGAGKTEAAIFLLLQALLAKAVNGGYFGLPTTLTSNRIYQRLCNSLQEKVESGRIQLSHGKAWIEENRIQSFGENLSSEAYAWLCGPNLSLSSALGIGTIDQALMAAIHTNHWPLRSLLLRKKLIICDEVHSYDAYTTSLMGHAIKNWTREQDCSVLCLSATLSDNKKKLLLGESFPLTSNEFGFSYLTKRETTSLPIEIGDSIPFPHVTLKKIRCCRLDPEDPNYQTALRKAIEQAAAGHKVLWICNSVHNAQKTYQLANHPLARLIHSRYTAEDRSIREQEILEEFEIDNAKGVLLIGTQVLEQSLDLNADVLYSELCPIELLFQRVGRLWRKTRKNRPSEKCEAHILTTKENPATRGLHLFGRTANVYGDPYQLLRAWEWVDKTNALNKTKVREALHFALSEETPISEKAKRTEAETYARAKAQAAETAPTLCKPVNPNTQEISAAGNLEERETSAPTRLNAVPQIELVLYRDTQTFWNGTQIENRETPTRNDRLQIEKNSVRTPTYLLSSNPQEAEHETKLGFGKFQWLTETEYDYGMTYHSELGLIPHSFI